ncbi:MAG: phosphoenolpyruvate--protein phosphotransferase [Planctomycetes bacterium]|nr:phosphoenolpyruvate--protein phosphotransferase [Planctomycetota bacterium]
MIELHGQKVTDGIVMGPITVLTVREVKVKEAFVEADKVPVELRRFERALVATQREIDTLLEALEDEQGDVWAIIQTSLEFLRDDYLLAEIRGAIETDRCTATYAVSRTIAQLTSHLEAIDNPTFSSKVADLIDIEHRLLNNLMGGRLERVQQLDRQLIVIADDLTPAQAATLDRDKVIGFATERGSWASHTAILARALGIPAVVAVPGLTRAVTLDSRVIVDGSRGLVIIDPDDAQIEDYRSRRRAQRRRLLSERQMVSLPSETRDGQLVRLYCNIETKHDIPRVLESGAVGVGLFRTEFLFLGQTTPLDEEAQYRVYREAVEGIEGKMLAIRSIDFGADKFDRRHGAHQATEPNPFMGERAIRLSLKHEEFFRVQLRAVLRAAVHGKIRLMFPMVMDLGEFRQACAVVERAKAELRERGAVFDENLAIGTMIELPSAALNAERLAKEADFFSIGTNDLTQYTLGIDRTNQRVSRLYAPCHPSVLNLIRHVSRAARRAGRYLSICGEMAGDPDFLPLLIGLGIRNLSMAPPQVPKVKRALRTLFVSHCNDLAESALEAADAAEVRALLLKFRETLRG